MQINPAKHIRVGPFAPLCLPGLVAGTGIACTHPAAAGDPGCPARDSSPAE